MVDPGALLVASIAIADGTADHQSILITSNGDGETAHSYWNWPDHEAKGVVWMDDDHDC